MEKGIRNVAKKASEEVTGDEIIDFAKEFASESDRAAVILGAAKLDTLLFQLLQKFLLPSVSSSDELLEGEAGLGTFSARIHAAYRLGLIDAGLTRALHLIRRIRNSFAHETSATDLSVGSHRDRIRELVAPLRVWPRFNKLRDYSFLENTDGSSKDFRVGLAVVAARLLDALENVRPLSASAAMPLVKDSWKKETENEQA